MSTQTISSDVDFLGDISCIKNIRLCTEFPYNDVAGGLAKVIWNQLSNLFSFAFGAVCCVIFQW